MPASMIYQFRIRRDTLNNGAKNENPMRLLILETNIHVSTFIGAFTGMGLIGYINSLFLPGLDNIFLIGSFGASSVLIFGIINSPLAQHRNLIGGHLISVFVGVAIYKLLLYLSKPLNHLKRLYYIYMLSLTISCFWIILFNAIEV